MERNNSTKHWAARFVLTATLLLMAAISSRAVTCGFVIPGPNSHYKLNTPYYLNQFFVSWNDPAVDEGPYLEIWSDIDNENDWDRHGYTNGLSRNWTVANQTNCEVDWRLKYYWEHNDVPQTETHEAGPYFTP